MKGRFLSVCLAIALAGILPDTAIEAQTQSLFGPPPVTATTPESVKTVTLARTPAEIEANRLKRAAEALADSVVVVTDEADDSATPPKPLGSVDSDPPATSGEIRPLPNPASPGYSSVGDAGWQVASQPLYDPGYAEAGEYEPLAEPDIQAVMVTDNLASCCPEPVCDSISACGSEGCRQCVEWTLPQLRALDRMGIRLGGWVDQGISVVANMPADHYNGTVTFNDRDDEYQANQIWLYLEREVGDCPCGWDIGGRVDFLYGTDARFIQASDGLESTWGQTEPFYQVALPQAYVDVAYRDWTVRTGRFMTILGYESPMAPENFFYSHSYAMQYGEPFTHFGVLGMRRIGRLTLSAGVHRGNDQVDDTDGLDSLNVLGGASLTSCDERMTGAFAFTATEDGPGVTSYIQSLVATMQLTNRLSYIFQSDYGRTRHEMDRSDVWVGINQYLLYTINDCWGAGIRAEWFRDRDGARVAGQGVGNMNTGPYAGDFYEITLGLNWSPHANLTVRPEARWDIYDPSGLEGGLGAFDAGESDNQFVFGCDLICTF